MAGTFELALSAFDVSGAALGRHGDEAVLVHGALPGERVLVRRLRPLGSRTLGELVEVLRPSPQRVVPRCRHAARCGGCAWQHVAYAEQLRLKSAQLAASLRRTLGDRAPHVRPAIGMPVGEDGMPWGFRQKAAFVFGWQDGRLTLGHFARGSHEVVEIEECPVHVERANRIAFALRAELRQARVRPAGPDLHGLVRTSADAREAVALLVATRDDPRLRAALASLRGRPAAPDGAALNLHDRPGPFLVGRETRRVFGNGHVEETGLGPRFLVSPTAFFQTNVVAAATLLRLVAEACDSLRSERPLEVLDLYSGSGLFALPLALRGHAVTAVEESRKGVGDAELNRKANAIPEERLRLVCSAVERALPRLAGAQFDVVLLDPPREGAPRAVVAAVFGRLRPRRGILVSCNPEALARELAVALANGYRAREVQPVDMFPHTPHVEAVAVLEPAGRGPSGPGRVVKPRTPTSRSPARGSRSSPARGRSRTP